MAMTNQNYIIVVTSPNGQRQSFDRLIACDSLQIVEYVKGLSFGQVTFIYFFDVNSLNSMGRLTLSGAERVVSMLNNKSFDDFYTEVAEVIKDLKIKDYDNDDE